jgi:MraZ protein
MVMPTRYRERLLERCEGKLVVTVDRDQCLLLYPLPEIDGHGRVLLPPKLREFAHLNRNAILIGQGSRFELWDEQRWDERRDEWLQAEDSAELLPPELGSLSL